MNPAFKEAGIFIPKSIATISSDPDITPGGGDEQAIPLSAPGLREVNILDSNPHISNNTLSFHSGRGAGVRPVKLSPAESSLIVDWD